MKHKTKIPGLLAALIVGQLLFVGPAGAADEGVSTARNYIKSPTTGMCLLGGMLDKGTGWVGTWPCKPDYWLVWEWYGDYHSERGARIKGVVQGSCLDSNDRGDVYMHRCLNDSPNQFWKVYRTNDGRYAKIENWATHRCLEEPFEGGAVQTHGCRDDTSKQWWRFVDHPAQ